MSRCLNYVLHANFDWLLQSGDVTSALFEYIRTARKNVNSIVCLKEDVQECPKVCGREYST